MNGGCLEEEAFAEWIRCCGSEDGGKGWKGWRWGRRVVGFGREVVGMEAAENQIRLLLVGMMSSQPGLVVFRLVL